MQRFTGRLVAVLLAASMLVAGCTGKKPDEPRAEPKRALPLLYTDLDGTLLSDDGTVSAKNLAALKRYKAAGGRYGVSTGRFPDSARTISRQIGATLPVISANGAVIEAPEGPMIRLRPITDTAFIGAVCKALTTYSCKTYYTAYMGPGTRISFAGQKCAPAPAGQVVFKMKAWRCADHDGFLGSLKKAFPRAATYISAGPNDKYGISISGYGVDKGEAMLHVARRLGVPGSRVVFVGDSGNDIPGARAVRAAGGRCYVVSEGTKALKAACPKGHLALTNDDGAVASVVDMLLKK